MKLTQNDKAGRRAGLHPLPSTNQRIELKVCEGCGALWLRSAGLGVYCRGCTAWLSDFPAPPERRSSLHARERRLRRRAVTRLAAQPLTTPGGAQ